MLGRGTEEAKYASKQHNYIIRRAEWHYKQPESFWLVAELNEINGINRMNRINGIN